jgi:hypothetical protein
MSEDTMKLKLHIFEFFKFSLLKHFHYCMIYNVCCVQSLGIVIMLICD